ncbi:unnamed protein product, partial [Musa acuminata subsp. malaccensis]
MNRTSDCQPDQEIWSGTWRGRIRGTGEEKARCVQSIWSSDRVLVDFSEETGGGTDTEKRRMEERIEISKMSLTLVLVPCSSSTDEAQPSRIRNLNPGFLSLRRTPPTMPLF